LCWQHRLRGICPPASNNCDIWKEPLWFLIHLIPVSFGQNPQVWQRDPSRPGAEREKRVKGSEQGESVSGETQKMSVLQTFQQSLETDLLMPSCRKENHCSVRLVSFHTGNLCMTRSTKRTKHKSANVIPSHTALLNHRIT